MHIENPVLHMYFVEVKLVRSRSRFTCICVFTRWNDKCRLTLTIVERRQLVGKHKRVRVMPLLLCSNASTSLTQYRHFSLIFCPYQKLLLLAIRLQKILYSNIIKISIKKILCSNILSFPHPYFLLIPKFLLLKFRLYEHKKSSNLVSFILPYFSSLSKITYNNQQSSYYDLPTTTTTTATIKTSVFLPR